MFWYIQNAVLFTWAARLELAGGGSVCGRGRGGGSGGRRRGGVTSDDEDGRSADSLADPWSLQLLGRKGNEGEKEGARRGGAAT